MNRRVVLDAGVQIHGGKSKELNVKVQSHDGGQDSRQDNIPGVANENILEHSRNGRNMVDNDDAKLLVDGQIDGQKTVSGRRVSQPSVGIVGVYPPPYGGISVHVERLHHHLKSIGVESKVYDGGEAA